MARTSYTRAELEPARGIFEALLDGVCRAKIETQANSLDILQYFASIAAKKSGCDVGYFTAGMKMIIAERSAERNRAV